MTPLPNHACPVCGGPNGCAPAQGGDFDVRCWCMDVVPSADALAAVPADQVDRACLCRRCLAGGSSHDRDVG
jgi:hypothetical protein